MLPATEFSPKHGGFSIHLTVACITRLKPYSHFLPQDVTLGWESEYSEKMPLSFLEAFGLVEKFCEAYRSFTRYTFKWYFSKSGYGEVLKATPLRSLLWDEASLGEPWICSLPLNHFLLWEFLTFLLNKNTVLFLLNFAQKLHGLSLVHLSLFVL